MDPLTKIIEKAKQTKKKIVLPESEDSRMLSAADEALRRVGGGPAVDESTTVYNLAAAGRRNGRIQADSNPWPLVRELVESVTAMRYRLRKLLEPSHGLCRCSGS